MVAHKKQPIGELLEANSDEMKSIIQRGTRTLANVIIKISKDTKEPQPIRYYYKACKKLQDWNPRSVRRTMDDLIMAGFVTNLKCPCGHSHLYIDGIRGEQIRKHGYTFKFK